MGAFVSLRETLERDIDGEHFFCFRVIEERHVVARLERHAPFVTAALQARAGSRVIHENAAHRLSGNREEAVAVGSSKLTLLQETKVHLVDEGGGRKRMAG
jgi:hypothetical protein